MKSQAVFSMAILMFFTMSPISHADTQSDINAAFAQSGTPTKKKAKSTDVDKVRVAMIGQKFAAPSGFTLEMDGNHHLHKPVMIGEIRGDGRPHRIASGKGGQVRLAQQGDRGSFGTEQSRSSRPRR